jgi:hypothetical protein
MPRPVLQAIVLADNVYQDRATGKFIISGTFTRIGVTKKPPPAAAPDQPTTFKSAGELVRAVSTAGSPHLYVALTDVHGSVPLKVRFVDLSDSGSRFEMGLEVKSVDPLTVTEFAIPMPRLPVTAAGAFSLDLLYADEILGSWRIVVTEEPAQPPPPNPGK